MGKFVKNLVKSIFGGKTDEEKEAEAAAKQAQEAQKISQTRQLQETQNEEQEQRGALSGARRNKGRRLLLAAETGEAGVKSTLG